MVGRTTRACSCAAVLLPQYNASSQQEMVRACPPYPLAKEGEGELSGINLSRVLVKGAPLPFRLAFVLRLAYSFIETWIFPLGK